MHDMQIANSRVEEARRNSLRIDARWWAQEEIRRLKSERRAHARLREPAAKRLFRRLQQAFGLPQRAGQAAGVVEQGVQPCG